MQALTSLKERGYWGVKVHVAVKFLAVNVNIVSSVGFSSSQNPLIQPTVGPDVSGTVTTELLQGLSEIVAEDTNNILVQVFI